MSDQNYSSLLSSALSSAIALLQHCDKEQLNAILNDTNKLDALINDLPQMKSQTTEREMLLAQNKSLAEWNCAQEPKLRQAKQLLLHTYGVTEQDQRQLVELKQKLDSLTNKRSVDSALVLLQAAAQEAEDESEKIAELFVDGQLSVEEFLQQFCPKRSLAHSRKIKCDKMSELLRQQPTRSKSMGSFAPKRAAPPPPQNQNSRSYSHSSHYPTYSNQTTMRM